VRIAKAGSETAQAMKKKYVGSGGRLKIYFGAPMFFTALGAVLFGEKLLWKAGNATGAYLGLGCFLAIVGVSLYLFDRIPKTLIVPIGIMAGC